MAQSSLMAIRTVVPRNHKACAWRPPRVASIGTAEVRPLVRGMIQQVPAPASCRGVVNPCNESIVPAPVP